MNRQAPKLTRRQREQRAQAQADPLAWAVRQVASELAMAETSASGWLEALAERATEQARSAPEWPKCPEQLGRRFGELSEGLALLGVILSHRRSGSLGRLWRAETVAHCEKRRHFEAMQKKQREAQALREREEQAQLRAAISLARELRRRERRKTE